MEEHVQDAEDKYGVDDDQGVIVMNSLISFLGLHIKLKESEEESEEIEEKESSNERLIKERY